MNFNFKIAIAEPSTIIRCGLETVLRQLQGFHIQIVEICNMESLQESLRMHKPELLIINPAFPGYSPMWGEIRSLNLSNSVAVVLYEALRHNDFEKMALEGQLHHMKWKDGWEQK